MGDSNILDDTNAIGTPPRHTVTVTDAGGRRMTISLPIQVVERGGAFLLSTDQEVIELSDDGATALRNSLQQKVHHADPVRENTHDGLACSLARLDEAFAYRARRVKREIYRQEFLARADKAVCAETSSAAITVLVDALSDQVRRTTDGIVPVAALRSAAARLETGAVLAANGEDLARLVAATMLVAIQTGHGEGEYEVRSVSDVAAILSGRGVTVKDAPVRPQQPAEANPAARRLDLR